MKGIVFITKKQSQLFFLSILFLFFGVFISAIFISDQPSSSNAVPTNKPAKSPEEIIEIEPGNYLFKLDLVENDTYADVSSKAKELNATVEFYNKQRLSAVLSVDKSYSEKEWMTHLKRKYINSDIKLIDEIAFENTKSEKIIKIDNTSTFYNPERDFFTSLPTTWSFEIKDDVYTFLNATDDVILLIQRHKKEEGTIDGFIQKHLDTSQTNGFSLDGDIESIPLDSGVIHHRWVLTDNNIFIPQGIIEVDDSIFFFNSKEFLSFDDFSLVFDNSQIFK